MTTEVRDRWILHTGIAGLLLVALAPLTGHLGEAMAPLLDRCRELLSACVLILRAVSAPLQWIPIVLLVSGIAYAVWDRLSIRGKLRRLLLMHTVRLPRPDEPVGILAREFGLEYRVHVLVGVAPNPAFTVGILRPRILIADDLQRMLTSAELRAVFRHEVCHLRRRDPLRFAALRFMAKTLFWLPLLHAWIQDWMEDAEILADDFAASRADGVDPLDVASALVALGRANVNVWAGVAAIGGFRLLDRRVRRLAGLPSRHPMGLPARPALLSAGALMLFWMLALAGSSSAHAMMHGDVCPHGAHGAEEHCAKCDQPYLPNHRCTG